MRKSPSGEGGALIGSAPSDRALQRLVHAALPARAFGLERVDDGGSRRRLTSCFVGAFCLPRTRLALAANSGRTSAKGLAFAISSAVHSERPRRPPCPLSYKPCGARRLWASQRSSNRHLSFCARQTHLNDIDATGMAGRRARNGSPAIPLQPGDAQRVTRYWEFRERKFRKGRRQAPLKPQTQDQTIQASSGGGIGRRRRHCCQQSRLAPRSMAFSRSIPTDMGTGPSTRRLIIDAEADERRLPRGGAAVQPTKPQRRREFS